ncbi:hypothetical protein ACSSVY_004545 [Roseovarius sp. MBR-51]
MTGPLDHLKNIELGHAIAGPLSAALLSDVGAEVIKVEAPNRTDMMRDLGPNAADRVGVWWKTLGRNKKTLSLNWKADEGRNILRKLVKGADVLERAGVGLDRNLMEAGMTELTRLERDGPIGILRFLQPETRSPYSIAFVEELVAHLRDAEQDDTIRALIMTGGDHFSSGGELVGFQSEVAKGARAASEMVDKVHDGGRAVYLFQLSRSIGHRAKRPKRFAERA